jgi:hypothetical protein
MQASRAEHNLPKYTQNKQQTSETCPWSCLLSWIEVTEVKETSAFLAGNKKRMEAWEK